MGILTNLLDTAWKEQDSRRKEEQDRFATIAQIPGIRPEIQEWAIDQLVKTAPKGQPGLKDIGGLFKGLIRGNRGGDQAQQGLQQAIQSTGRPGMQADVPAGPGALAGVLPAEKTQVGPVAPSMMLSPQEQLNLKLDEFKRTESVRNDLAEQFQKFMDDRKADNQQKADTQEFDELNRRISSFTAGGYNKQEATDMAYASMGKPAPVRGGSAVSGLVLGSDPQLQEWGKASGVAIDPTKQYHVIRNSAGKITQALEGPAAGGKAGLKGALGELADAQAIVDEGVGGKNKFTASEVKAAKDFITKYNRPPTTVVNLGEKKAEAKDIAGAIISGDQPPILTGMGMGGAGALRKELADRKYNLTRAMEDWQATTRYIASLNSAQQLRLRQATEFSRESLDLLDNPEKPGNDLIGQLRRFIPRTKFKVLNRAALEAATNGAFGEAATSAATQLQSQIRDLQSELATVYKGGNSPTDVGLKQAGEMLSGDWSENTLRDAIDLSRKNLQYRLNSIKSAGPAGAGGGQNQYLPPSAPTPVDTTPINRAGGTGPHFPPPRKGAKLDSDTARKYLNGYGGNKQAAYNAATTDGWQP